MELQISYNQHISSCRFSIWTWEYRESCDVWAFLKIGIWTSSPLSQQLKSTSYLDTPNTWTSISLFFGLYDVFLWNLLSSAFLAYSICLCKKSHIHNLQFYQTNPWDTQHNPKLDNFFHTLSEEFWTSDRFTCDYMAVCFSLHTSYNLSFHSKLSLESDLGLQANLIYWSCYQMTWMLNYNRTELIRIYVNTSAG
jgi:hypothetical protein